MLVSTVFDFMMKIHQDCHPVDRELDPMLEVAMIEEMQQVLSGWFKQPIFPGAIAGVSPATMARSWSWAIFGVATEWSRGTRQPAIDEMTRQMVALLMHGMLDSISR